MSDSWDGVEVIIKPPGQAPLRFLLDKSTAGYEPFWEGAEPQGAAKHLLHLRGIIREWGPAKPETKAQVVVAQALPAEIPAADALPKGPEEQSSEMYRIFEKWKDCKRCTLATPHRRSVVFGSGDDIHPKILVIGEAPGPEENKQGIPFIGVTGQYMRKHMRSVGINPDEDCYITNAVLCFPTDDGYKFRGPRGSEILTCRERLQEQFALLTTRGTLKAIVLVGKRAHVTFFHREQLERGEFEDDSDLDDIGMDGIMGWYAGAIPWPGLKVMTIWHPSYLVRKKASEASRLFQGWKQDLQALSDWALKGQLWDPRPVK